MDQLKELVIKLQNDLVSDELKLDSEALALVIKNKTKPSGWPGEYDTAQFDFKDSQQHFLNPELTDTPDKIKAAIGKKVDNLEDIYVDATQHPYAEHAHQAMWNVATRISTMLDKNIVSLGLSARADSNFIKQNLSYIGGDARVPVVIDHRTLNLALTMQKALVALKPILQEIKKSKFIEIIFGKNLENAAQTVVDMSKELDVRIASYQSTANKETREARKETLKKWKETLENVVVNVVVKIQNQIKQGEQLVAGTPDKDTILKFIDLANSQLNNFPTNESLLRKADGIGNSVGFETDDSELLLDDSKRQLIGIINTQKQSLENKEGTSLASYKEDLKNLVQKLRVKLTLPQLQQFIEEKHALALESLPDTLTLKSPTGEPIELQTTEDKNSLKHDEELLVHNLDEHFKNQVKDCTDQLNSLEAVKKKLQKYITALRDDTVPEELRDIVTPQILAIGKETLVGIFTKNQAEIDSAIASQRNLLASYQKQIEQYKQQLTTIKLKLSSGDLKQSKALIEGELSTLQRLDQADQHLQQQIDGITLQLAVIRTETANVAIALRKDETALEDQIATNVTAEEAHNLRIKEILEMIQKSSFSNRKKSEK